MAVTSPTTALRNVLLAVLNDEFSDDGITFISDKLHESVGHKRSKGAVYPNLEEQWYRDEMVTNPEVTVQLYAKYRLEIDPDQQVDPTLIETYAERFKRALLAANPGGTAIQWYPTIVSIAFPDDPTGNKTRFEAIVRGHAQNTALVETAI